MYEMTIEFHNGETATISLPSIECVWWMSYQLNENCYVNGELIAARNGKRPGASKNEYFAGFTREGLEKLYGER